MPRKPPEPRDPYDSFIEYLPMGQWPMQLGFTTCRRAFARESVRIGLAESEDSPDATEFHVSPRAEMTTHFIHDRSLVIITANPAPDMKINQTRKGVVSVEAYVALLAHEAVHVAQYIKDELSADHPLGVESEAYLVQHIVMFCMGVAFNTGRSKADVPVARAYEKRD